MIRLDIHNIPSCLEFYNDGEKVDDVIEYLTNKNLPLNGMYAYSGNGIFEGLYYYPKSTLNECRLLLGVVRMDVTA